MILRSRNSIYLRIRAILEAVRGASARSVNTAQVVANWLIGREIVEDEQKGQRKAGYGEALLQRLAGFLAADFGSGYSETNLRWFRQFYLEYESLLPREIHHAVRDKSGSDSSARHSAIHRATIFASRYKLHLPSEAELRAELRREVRAFIAPTKDRGVK